MKFHFGTSSWGGTRKPPPAFTEQGVAMLSSVLRSKRAIEVNIMIIRTFVKLRRMISTHKDLARKLAELEKKYDSQFKVVFDALRSLMSDTRAEGKENWVHQGESVGVQGSQEAVNVKPQDLTLTGPVSRS